MAYFTIDELKIQLNIESNYNDDNEFLNQLSNVVEIAVGNYCNYGLTGYTGSTIPTPVKQAAIMLASHLYTNRQIVSFAQGFEIPYTFKFLLDPYKNFVVV